MTTYWDIMTVTVDNQSGYNLSCGSIGALEHGEWNDYPTSSIASGATTEAFSIRSLNASEVGPGPGSVSYGLPDGAALNISFDMIFVVGGTSYVTAAISGATASRYKVAFSTCQQEGWHGQGKRFNATIQVTVNPAGPTSATCSKSHDD